MQRKACLADYFNTVDSEVRTGQVVWAWGTGMHPLTPLLGRLNVRDDQELARRPPKDQGGHNPCQYHARASPLALLILQEGFQPVNFRSSRSDRGNVKQQSIDDFLDQDELEERSRTHLQVRVRREIWEYVWWLCVC